MEDYGTTAKFTQFTTVLAVVQSALATVVGKIGIKTAIETTANRTDEVAKLLHAIFLSLRSGQKLMFVPTKAEQSEAFMVIDLGRYDVDRLYDALYARPRVSSHAYEIIQLTGFKVQKIKVSLKLVKISVFQLGFTENPTYDQICLRALELGYELCPVETGPLMRLKLEEHGVSNRWVIASLPLLDSMGGVGLFDLQWSDGVLWLGVTSAHQDVVFCIDTEFVFTVPSEVDF